MVFVSNTIQHNTMHSLFQNRVYFLGFSTPEQDGKVKTLVAHTHLIKVESPPRALDSQDNGRQKGDKRASGLKSFTLAR